MLLIPDDWYRAGMSAIGFKLQADLWSLIATCRMCYAQTSLGAIVCMLL